MEGDQDSLDVTRCEVSGDSNVENQAKNDALEKKAIHLRVILEKDYKAADFKWSLFVAAAHSYRYDTCLRPFPPHFLKNGQKDMDELLTVIGEVPALDLLVQQLDSLENLVNIEKIIELLFWVLVKLKEPTLKTVPSEMHKEILKSAKNLPPESEPTQIFEIVSSTKISAENKWQELAKNQETFYAFHGSRLENFHSILFFGLHHHLNKNAMLGNGIYLSSELGASLPYSHDGFAWGASCLGGHLSCVALCEVIDAPEGINYHRPSKNEAGETSSELREQYSTCSSSSAPMGPTATVAATGSGKVVGADGKTAQIYYIVTNNDLVRVRYVLVYAKNHNNIRDRISAIPDDERGMRRWFGRHKLFSILLGYGVMLATIGFSNNQPIHFYYRLMLKKLDIALNNIKV